MCSTRCEKKTKIYVNRYAFWWINILRMVFEIVRHNSTVFFFFFDKTRKYTKKNHSILWFYLIILWYLCIVKIIKHLNSVAFIVEIIGVAQRFLWPPDGRVDDPLWLKFSISIHCILFPDFRETNFLVSTETHDSSIKWFS